MANPTADRRGEGFAFHMWHILKYGYYADACSGYDIYRGCGQEWNGLQGRTT
jgi:hypothetical protein